MPPELVPLALVMALGLGGIDPSLNSMKLIISAAGFSMTYKLLADPTVFPLLSPYF